MYFFSVIVPVYNIEHYLKECVESVLKQDFKNVEIILVDDFSTDKSGIICDEFANKNENIRVFHQPINLGVAACRNMGIQAAGGRYIIFLDSDDYLLEGSLGGLAKLIEEKRGTDVIIGKFICRPEAGGGLYRDYAYDGAVINKGKPNDVIAHINSMANSAAGFLGVCWRYIIRRNFVFENNLYFVPAKVYEDQEFIAKVLCLSKTFAFYDDFFYCYRTRPKSLSGIVDCCQANSSAFEVVGELCKFIKNNELSDIKKNFIYARIRYLVSAFNSRLVMLNCEEILELSLIIEKHIGHIDMLKEVANDFKIYSFIKTSGSFAGLVLYKKFIIEKTISLVKKVKEKEFYIFCAGIFGEGMAHILLDNGYSVKGFLDNNQAFEKTNILGLNVSNPSILLPIPEQEFSEVVVVICNQRREVFKEISTQLQEIGLKKEQIVHKAF